MDLKVIRRGEVVSPSMDEMEPVIYRLKKSGVLIVAVGALLFEDKDTIKSIFKEEAEVVDEDTDIRIDLDFWVQYECVGQTHKLYGCVGNDVVVIQNSLHGGWAATICMTQDRFKKALRHANFSSVSGWIESPGRMGG